jgi:hypothetical protein
VISSRIGISYLFWYVFLFINVIFII